jgi:hypothetical protein
MFTPEPIDTQQLFDFTEPVQVAPGATVQLTVDVPGCAAQIDLFHGPLLPTLNGQRYGDRLIGARLLNQNAPCQNTVIEECSIGALTLEGVLPGQNLTGTAVIEARLTGPDRPQRVEFILSGPRSTTHTEINPPYFFLGNQGSTAAGWDIGAYPAGAYVLEARAIQGGLVCQSAVVSFTIGMTTQPPIVIMPGPVEVTPEAPTPTTTATPTSMPTATPSPEVPEATPESTAAP